MLGALLAGGADAEIERAFSDEIRVAPRPVDGGEHVDVARRATRRRHDLRPRRRLDGVLDAEDGRTRSWGDERRDEDAEPQLPRSPEPRDP
jgi:hypothetical protein